MSPMVRLTEPLSSFYSGPMTGADFLQLSPAAAPVRGLTGWLADAIRAAVMDGRLGAGAPLPATRLLAGDLGVSRGVIVEVYQRLADEGLVSARPGTGTRVLGVPRLARGEPRAAGVSGVTGIFGGTGFSGVVGVPGADEASTEGLVPAEGAVPAGEPELVPAGGLGLMPAEGAVPAGGLGLGLVPAGWRERAEIDLSPGVPDLSGFPRTAWLRAERLVLERASVA